jgi:glycosyltransferase involved in cell wall biosynthesis
LKEIMKGTTIDGTQRIPNRSPEVSIGMPVYNGETHLREAIDSLLRQSFADFELIISDNASTDRTSEICEAYAREDPRIRYQRLPRNIGSARNWNRLVAEARGRFFKWTSCNDRCEPDMLRRCVDVLQHDEGAILCFGRTLLINEDGSPHRVYERDHELAHKRPADRFVAVCRDLALNNAQAGLMRLAGLKQTGLERLYPAGDIVLMAELALRGRFRLLPEVLLHRRIGRYVAVRALSADELKIFVNPIQPGMKMISWRYHLDFLQAVMRAPIPPDERWQTLVFSLKQAYWDRAALVRDCRQLFLPTARQRLA